MILAIFLCLGLAASVHGGSQCGVSSASRGLFHPANWRIYGGTPAKAHEFPWQISLKNPATNYGHHCGGTILNEQWILTAAHCILPAPRVVLGDINFDDKTGEEITVEIEEWVTHPLNPKDDPRAFLKQYDVALIKIKTKLDFEGAHKHLAPICIPTMEEDATYTGKDCIATGFGNTEKGGPSRVLLKVDVPVWENEKCAAIMDDDELQLTERIVCVGGDETTNKGACNGDSGGPVQCKRDDGSYAQIGIASFVYGDGRGTCYQNYPNAYSRVAAFRDWILETIEN